jgi:hypothetical protein
MAAIRRDGRRNESAGPTAEGLVALAFSPYRVVVVLSQAGRKIQKLLELPPIPAPRPPKHGCIHEKHDILSFFLGKRSLQVRRMHPAMPIDEGGEPGRPSTFRQRLPSCLSSRPQSFFNWCGRHDRYRW